MAESERPRYVAVIQGDEYFVEIVPAPIFSSYPKSVKLTKEEYETGFVPYIQGWKKIQEAFPNMCWETKELIRTGLDPHENPECCD